MSGDTCGTLPGAQNAQRPHSPVHLGKTTGLWVAGGRDGGCQANPTCPGAPDLSVAVPHTKPSKRAAIPSGGGGQRPRSGGRQRGADLRKDSFRSSGVWVKPVVFSTSLFPPLLHSISGSCLSSLHPSLSLTHAQTVAARWLWPHTGAQRISPVPPTPASTFW